MVSLRTGGAVGGGALPHPQNFFLILDNEMAFFGAFWSLYFTIQLPALRTESAYIGDRYSFHKNEPERRSGFKKRTGTPFRCVPVQFEP